MLPLLLLCVGLATPRPAACSTYQAFDYIIVGGGPAGLLVANKLSADPNITVAVVEAGDEQFNNPNVTDVDGFGAGLGTAIDWSYMSTPQEHVLNRTLVYYSGKALGGTTTINGMTYVRAEKAQIDAWEELGNEGWNWDSLFPYFTSSEHFQPPDADKAANGATFEEQAHGFDGEVAVGWSKYFMKDGVFSTLKETNEKLGIKWNRDVNGGNMPGFTTWPFTLNATTNIRQDAARAYYYPIAKQRPNLHVFLNTTATRIIWKSDSNSSSPLVATGLEILPSTNTTTTTPQTLTLKHELILAAGSLRSPALLEHSGIGNPSILTPLNITTRLALPSVGGNFQDQPNTPITYTSTLNLTGYPSFVTYLTASDLFGAALPTIAAELHANTSTYASLLAAASPPNETTPAIQARLLTHQTHLIFSPTSTVPLAELIWFPLGSTVTCVFWTLLPFSRGSVHIRSRDPRAHPAINPNFLQLPIDTTIQAAAAVKVRELFATPPLAGVVVDEVTPGFDVVPQGAGWDDDKWGVWFRDVYQPNHHPVCSTAMRGREWGGVVDSNASVYGVRNVRVVDAGALPEQTSGHLTAAVYAFAGRVAEGILMGRGGE